MLTASSGNTVYCFTFNFFFSDYFLRKKTSLLFSSLFSPQSITVVLMISLSAKIIGAFPRGGFVMELMIVVIMKMNQIKRVQVKVLLGCA